MSIEFPTTSEQLKADGWIYDDEMNCRGCGAVIEIWVSPDGDEITMSVISTATIKHASGDLREPHVCE
jgi:hypothetical protein